jgi:antitoxin YefM
MDAVNYSNFRKRLKDYFKQVNENSEPLIVTNKDPEDNVVILSKDEYDSLMETLSVQSNSYLMNKINVGKKEVKNKQLSEHKLIEPDNEE